ESIVSSNGFAGRRSLLVEMVFLKHLTACAAARARVPLHPPAFFYGARLDRTVYARAADGAGMVSVRHIRDF
ncbi:MAG TPA: hypothetical protein VEQ40_00980, partial [Pyrinomonadaceae bacterium]|nr:hypothetical protein [Pyrinomonadaceae bacterium]